MPQATHPKSGAKSAPPQPSARPQPKPNAAPVYQDYASI